MDRRTLILPTLLAFAILGVNSSSSAAAVSNQTTGLLGLPSRAPKLEK
jgi:hypothetical protein